MENVEFDGDEATVEVNTGLFDFDVVKSAAYVLLDRAYFSFGGDPEESIEVCIKAKDGEDIQNIVRDFQNELVSYSVYEKESQKNSEVREAIIKRAMATNLEGKIEDFEGLKEFLSPEKREDLHEER
ncbi:MAG: hypothetical protein ACLFTY_04180 [Candidatus Aenigmatarchaeota archaeon]